MKFIEKHNQEAASGQHTFTVGQNQYADLTVDEFSKFVNGLIKNQSMPRDDLVQDYTLRDLPASVDWRKEVRNVLLNVLSFPNSFFLNCTISASSTYYLG